jgi:hypothetical protein
MDYRKESPDTCQNKLAKMYKNVSKGLHLDRHKPLIAMLWCLLATDDVKANKKYGCNEVLMKKYKKCQMIGYNSKDYNSQLTNLISNIASLK